MARRWRTSPALAIEGEQTGDGRVIAAGALYWATDLGSSPLPLRWDREDDGFHAGAVLIGSIDTLERRPDGTIYAEGDLHDAAEGSAELVALLEERGGLGVSVDLDDIAVEVVANADDMDEADEGGIMLIASAEPIGYGRPDVHPSAAALRAGAGDPDPVDDPDTETVLLYGYDVGEVVERLTRGRIRGATLVDIAAFDRARVELVAVEDRAGANDEDGDEDAQVSGEETALAAATVTQLHPPRSVFEMPEPEHTDDRYVDQPGGVVAIPLTIEDDGRVYGHVAAWGVCHTGFPGQCVTAPRSPSGYAAFHTGAARTAEGDTLSVGVLTVGTDHADLRAFAAEARDHYANTGLAWADVRAVDGEHGVWVSGRVRHGITADQVDVLRASSPSGDWRRIDGELDMVAVLQVNTPGFPVRRAVAAAAGLPELPDPQRTQVLARDTGEAEALVAAGRVAGCPDCQRARAEASAVGLSPEEWGARVADAVAERLRPELAALRVLEARTGHLRGHAARALAERIRPSA